MFGSASESTRAREAYFLEYARTVRSFAGSLPIVVTGGFTTAAGMAKAIESGDCDLVGLGRASCLTPDLARGILDGSLTELDVPFTGAAVHWPFGANAAQRNRTIDAALNQQWYTDQIHRLGAGRAPDVNRAWWRTAASATVRNGPGAFASKRS